MASLHRASSDAGKSITSAAGLDCLSRAALRRLLMELLVDIGVTGRRGRHARGMEAAWTVMGSVGSARGRGRRRGRVVAVGRDVRAVLVTFPLHDPPLQKGEIHTAFGALIIALSRSSASTTRHKARRVKIPSCHGGRWAGRKKEEAAARRPAASSSGRPPSWPPARAGAPSLVQRCLEACLVDSYFLNVR